MSDGWKCPNCGKAHGPHIDTCPAPASAPVLSPLRVSIHVSPGAPMPTFPNLVDYPWQPYVGPTCSGAVAGTSVWN